MSSGASSAETREPWVAPQSFREAVEDTERVAELLADHVAGHLLIPAGEVDFLARRLLRLTRAIQRALPPEVT